MQSRNPTSPSSSPLGRSGAGGLLFNREYADGPELSAVSQVWGRGRRRSLRPGHSILDGSFRYVPAAATSVVQTWRRFGWRPTTDDERKRRSQRAVEFVTDEALTA
jgi:hypothetical protein